MEIDLDLGQNRDFLDKKDPLRSKAHEAPTRPPQAPFLQASRVSKIDIARFTRKDLDQII